MIKKWYILPLLVLAGLIFLSKSTPNLTNLEAIDLVTTDHNFDIVRWEFMAIWKKAQARSLNLPDYLPTEKQVQLIKAYYSSPDLATQAGLDPDSYALVLESFIENQFETAISKNNLTGNFSIHLPVLYFTTPLPLNLIVSRRDIIQTEFTKVLDPIPLNELDAFEVNLDKRYGVSTIVEEIGGYSTYPTMVMRTPNFRWQSETIAHEWIHIYLATKPLGLNYTSQNLRTFNETVASIAGEEFGRMVFETYYAAPKPAPQPARNEPNPSIPVFDYQRFMFDTRNKVDSLLKEKMVEQAEAYMIDRKDILNQNGYGIRKINQAFFAFHGSYSSNPISAAGSDPIGDALRRFRAESPNLRVFLEKVSRISTDQEVEEFINNH